MPLALIDRETLECSYEEGTWCYFPPYWVEIVDDDPFLTIAKIAHHEAGHAVLSYVLRSGVGSINTSSLIGLEADGYDTTHRFGGVFYPGPRFNRSDVAEGIILCAGPAAERRHLFEHGLFDVDYDDNYIASGVRSDHAQFVDLNLDREIIWNEAQRAIKDERLWRAICRVAEPLTKQLVDLEKERNGKQGLCTAQMTGARARAIMRREGVRVGCWEPGLPCQMVIRRTRCASVPRGSASPALFPVGGDVERF